MTHGKLADSAFTTLPFDRVSARTIQGHFLDRAMLGHLPHTTALKDINENDFVYTRGEMMAFLHKQVVARWFHVRRTDTLWPDTVTRDTILQVYTHFLPDDLTLLLRN